MDTTDIDKQNTDIDDFERSGESSWPPKSPDVSAEKPRKSRVWGYWVVIFLLFAAFVGVVGLWQDARDSVDRLRRELRHQTESFDGATDLISYLRSQTDSLETACRATQEEYSSFRQTMAGAFPLVITGIELENIDNNGNVETPGGQTLYHKDLKYVRPVIKYTGLKPGKKTFSVKFINADESLRKGSSSPKYYTYSSEYEIEEGPDHTLSLSGWGNDKKGTSWSAGQYRLEIWCDGKCHKLLFFTIK